MKYNLLELNVQQEYTGRVYPKELIEKKLEELGEMYFLLIKRPGAPDMDCHSSGVDMKNTIGTFQNLRVENNWLVGDVSFIHDKDLELLEDYELSLASEGNMEIKESVSYVYEWTPIYIRMVKKGGAS